MTRLTRKSTRFFVKRFPRGYLTLWVTFHLAVHIYSELASAQSTMFYQKASQCPAQALSSELTSGNFTARSVVQCAAMCLPALNCRSFSYDTSTKRCYLGNEVSDPTCSNMVPAMGLQHYDMKIVCRNGRVLNKAGLCKCPHGFIGQNCDILMKDCSVGYHLGQLRKHGVYWIFPTLSPEPFQVYCRMSNTPRTYFLNRKKPNMNFTRGWEDYKRGFGSVHGDFWLGLDHLHHLTHSSKYEFRFRVRLRVAGTFLYQFYKNVKVNNEKNNYRLTFASVKPPKGIGTLGDSLSPVNGANFSTPDRDNDDLPDINCAELHKAGFWFRGKGCTLCNPTGPLRTDTNYTRLGIPDEMFWVNDLSSTVPERLSAFLVTKKTKKNKKKKKKKKKNQRGVSE